MKNQLLLLEDVENLGRSGDIVSVKPGYGRNFLLPKKKAVAADKNTLRLQVKLKEERAKRAAKDKSEAEELSQRIQNKVVTIEVKVDPEGHMYGSVAPMDIVRALEKDGIGIEKRNVQLAHPIKTLGDHELELKLAEGVPASFTLKVISDVKIPEKAAPESEESSEEEEDVE